VRIRTILLTVTLMIGSAAGAVASNDPLYPEQWGMQRIGAEPAWSMGTGNGVVIAVVDTGVDLAHEDLAVPGKLVQGHDFEDRDSNPQDQHGHGTHVAGIAAAATNNGKGVAGTAPSAKIMPVRVLNALGVGVSITLIERQRAAEGIRWAVDHGAKVVNLSLGPIAGQGPGSDMAEAIAYAWSKGVVCVAAAGNDDGEDSGYSNQPALVVAATDSNDGLAGYSNKVGKAMWGISAPGSGIMSTYYNLTLASDHKSYRSLSGTSMATPHVAGAVAVLLSMGLSPQAAVDRILSTTDDLGSPGRDATFGAGRLNLAKATGNTSLGGPPPPAGQAPPDDGPGGGQSGGSHSQTGDPATSGGPAAADETASSTPTPTPTKGSPRAGAESSSESDKSNTALTLALASLLVLGVAGAYFWARFKASRRGA